MSRIIRKYEVTVYEDGKIEFNELMIKEDIKKVDYKKECSSRIYQSMFVIYKMKEIAKEEPEKSREEIYTTAIKYVAKYLKVESNTVNDKLTRQLGKKADEIRMLIFDYLNKGDYSELKELLESKIGKHSKVADKEFIEKGFKDMEDK